MKNKIWTSLLLLFSLSPALLGATYYVATNGSNSAAGSSAAPFATFAKAFSTMSAGDTLLIKDGTYSERMIDIPSGTAGHYTNIKAEHNFRVKVRVGSPLYISHQKSYIRIEGIKFDGNLTNSDCAVVVSSHHIKFLRCSFTGAEASASNWNVCEFVATSDASYILLEECWAWGTGRYKFLSGTKTIYRRCVARHDYAPAHQCACFHRYGVTDCEFQNCIALDGGLPDNSNGKFYGGIFNDNHDPFVDNTGKDLGCILLNLGAGTPINDIRIWGTRTVENCAVWDCYTGMDFSNFEDGTNWFSPSNVYVNHCTIGGLFGTSSTWCGNWGVFLDENKGTDVLVNNSLISRANVALSYVKTSDYNCLYGSATAYDNTTAGAHDNTNNPGLQYITRATPAGGNASDGGYRGAAIEKRYGVDESMWGDSGYEALTKKNLWPWPNEAEIKADMSSWNAQLSDGGYTSAGVLGTRGFCAPGNGLYGGPITLTSYIWEYLGNPCPPEIYGNTKTETLAPSPKDDPALQAIPNPLRRGAVCSFTIGGHRSVPLLLMIYNASGKRVAAFSDASRHAVQWNTAGIPAGMYLAQLTAGDNRTVRRIVVTR